MRIVSVIRREAGTDVDLDGTVYFFRPESDDPSALHVCAVTEEAHIARLLAIPEGYKVHPEEIYAPAPVGDAALKVELDELKKTVFDQSVLLSQYEQTVATLQATIAEQTAQIDTLTQPAETPAPDAAENKKRGGK
jgi:hypothetical protein